MDVFGLPLGTALAVMLMGLLPILTYVLHRLDRPDNPGRRDHRSEAN